MPGKYQIIHVGDRKHPGGYVMEWVQQRLQKNRLDRYGLKVAGWVNRMELYQDLPSGYKKLRTESGSLYELTNAGGGTRLYFAIVNTSLVPLLAAGLRRDQKKDIATAEKRLKKWLAEQA